MNWWQQLLTQLASSAVLIGAIGWLLANVIKTLIERTNESYKNQLQTSAQMQIDRAKYELDKSIMISQIRYQALHTKIAEIVAELYAQLSDTISTAGSLVSLLEYSGGPTKAERLRIFGETYNKLAMYFSRNRVYLQKGICDQMDALLKSISNHIIRFKVFVVEEEEGHVDKEASKVWGDVWHAITEKEIPPLREKLDCEFKKLLGIE